MRLVRPLLCVVSCVALCGAVTGAAWGASDNGEAAKAPRTILADAATVTKASPVVRISGSVIDGSQRVTLDIVSGRGSGGGTVIVKGAKFGMIVAPPDVYIKADAKTWTKLTHSKAAAQLFAGKWLQTTTNNSDFADAAQLFDIQALLGKLTSGAGAVSKGRTTSYRGQRAIPLRHGSNTLYVAATGQPYVIGLVGTGKNRGEVRFSGFGTEKLPAVPTDAINLDELEHAGDTTTTSG